MRRALILFLAVAAGPAMAAAQTRPARPARKAPPARAASPSPAPSPSPTPTPSPSPVVPEGPPARSIGLDEAVKLTIDRSPAVRRSEQDVRVRAGARRESSGVFSMTFNAKPEWDYFRAPLSPSSRGAEDRNRTLLRTSAEEFRKLSQKFADAQSLGSGDCPPELSNLTIEGQAITCDPNAASTIDMTSTVNLLRGLQINALIEDLKQRQSQILLQNQVLFNEAALRAQLALDRRGIFPLDETLKNVLLDLSLTKPLRNGVLVQGGLRFSSTEDNFLDKSRDPVFGGKGIKDHFLAGAGLALQVPLAKGRGATSADASERSAIASLEAARQTSRHTLSTEVLRTTLSYLNLAAAQEQYTLLRQSASTQRELMNATAQLVKAGESPKTDLDRMQARVADVEASAASSAISVLQARGQLAQSIGLTTSEVQVGPVAGQTIVPGPIPGAVPDDLDGLVKRALQFRADLEAARQTTEAAHALTLGARSDLRRRLDLTFQGAYSAAYESPFLRILPDEFETPQDQTPSRYYNPVGFWRAINRRYSPNFTIQLSLDAPFQNRQAKGRLLQAQSSQDRSAIRYADLRRTIEDNIVQLTSSVRRAEAEVKSRETAVAQQGETWRATQTIRASGEASLVDTLLTEEQLTSARLQLVQARLTYATNLARLRFETGSLVEYTGGRDPGQPPVFQGVDLVADAGGK